MNGKVTDTFGATPKLGDVEHGRHNNLNLVRLILASMVVYSHCFILLKRFPDEPMQRYLHFNDLGGTAVMSFFFLSGHLIFKSALRTAPLEFLAARTIRLLPALAAVTLLCAFALGPAVTYLALPDYFSAGGTWRYLGTMALHLGNMQLPGVFEGRTVNQPLWTLPSEWVMYFGMLLVSTVAAIRRQGRVSRADVAVAVGALIFTASLLPVATGTTHWIAFSILGAASYSARRWIPLSISVAALLFVVDLALVVTVPIAGKVLFPFMLCYVLLVIGFHPALYAQWQQRFGDYSYGIYIFA